MVWAAILSLVALILQIIPAISLTNDAEIIKTVSWTNAKFEIPFTNKTSSVPFVARKSLTGQMYISLNNVVQCRTDVQPEICRKYTWDDGCKGSSFECDLVRNLPGASEHDCGKYCEPCSEASSASVSVAAMSLVTALVQLTTDIQRSTANGDLNCQKAMGVITGLFGFGTTLAALNTFQLGCYQNLPLSLYTATFTYTLGPSFWCLFIATLLKIPDALLHAILPTPEYKRKEGYKTYDEEPLDITIELETEKIEQQNSP